jgi:hypothetical protein
MHTVTRLIRAQHSGLLSSEDQDMQILTCLEAATDSQPQRYVLF